MLTLKEAALPKQYIRLMGSALNQRAGGDFHEPFRILRVIARMNVGGPAIQITGLMQNLPAKSFEQKLLTGFCEKDEVDYLQVNDLSLTRTQIVGFGRRVNFFSDLRVLFRIMREIQTFNPHIIHTHTAKAGFLGRIAATLSFRRQLRVHTYHGHLLHGYFGGFKTRLVILIERFLARFTDGIVAVGSQVREDLLAAKIGYFEQYRIIGPGLEIGELPERASSINSFNLPRDKFIVTWIGRAVPVKAPHRILEIATECGLRGLRVQFVIVGEGPLLDDLKSLAKEKELPVAFLGWQSDIEKILSFSDLVLLTSENEGTPVALIQAQMAGVPVLTTDVGSASEVLKNNQSGFCLEYSVRDFADKIELLATDIGMKSSFGAIGKAYALDNFSVNRLVSDHAGLYKELISQSKS
jgi:glycosyltransferase involved in cell wall biosynthesis